VVTGCACRGYFILLSLLWGIYIDKSLVCAWCPTPMRTRLQPRFYPSFKVLLEWLRHSLIDDVHACPHMRHVRMHFSSLSPSSRLSPVLFLSLDAGMSVCLRDVCSPKNKKNYSLLCLDIANLLG
jgi:hypothetical protein